MLFRGELVTGGADDEAHRTADHLADSDAQDDLVALAQILATRA